MNAALSTRWMSLIGRIDALNRRERVMVLAAALVLVGFVGDTFLLAPQRMQRIQVERDVARERTELASIEAQLGELKRKLAADPDEVPKLRLKQLTAELSELNAGFQRIERSLVAPDQMARLLEQVMQRTPGISVVRLQTLAPTSLPEREADREAERGAGGTTAAGNGTTGAGGTAAAVATPAQPALWRHGVELTVRGSYADLLRYLDAVERLPVRVYFGRAVLDASQYPDVDLRLTVFTLGMDRSWLAL
jgi:MSHA biogenesis protein MshJ